MIGREWSHQCRPVFPKRPRTCTKGRAKPSVAPACQLANAQLLCQLCNFRALIPCKIDQHCHICQACASSMFMHIIYKPTKGDQRFGSEVWAAWDGAAWLDITAYLSCQQKFHKIYYLLRGSRNSLVIVRAQHEMVVLAVRKNDMRCAGLVDLTYLILFKVFFRYVMEWWATSALIFKTDVRFTSNHLCSSIKTMIWNSAV